VSVVCCQA